MAQRTPGVTTPPAEPSDVGRIAPSGRRNKTTNGGGPYSSFGQQINVRYVLLEGLLKIAHFLTMRGIAENATGDW